MATEIVKLCDRHLSDEGTPRVFATYGHSLTLDGIDYAIDLCDECEAKVWQPVASIVTVHGVKLGKRKPDETTEAAERRRDRDRERHHRNRAQHYHPNDDGSMICPVCGFEAGSRTGLGAHARHAHAVDGIGGAYALAAQRRADGDTSGND
jgi:hypothetical protein